ncbi:hypothetical protein, conserved [Trypanosoma brucei brucei TREU927]|uniref:Chromosomal passenger complex protein 2 n=1 Tax=Trypanosoma brucei brucei (strain 927/4 GUTat10.1) TaxID=185431 RepID=CPC2_TRYB2|nr:hypothetical protein, conserved [Trypanosoma brucei brucei TREU927]EAN80430.1 hypothetical protein, conserved [Trypanosoma brucei brucei TREU927]
MQWKKDDLFEGLRKLPRTPGELFGHRNKLNFILQKRFFIAPDMVELALNRQNGEQFNRCYAKLVMQAVAKFNNTTRSQLKVRVDPRLPKGLQLIQPDDKDTGANLKSKKSEKAASGRLNAFSNTTSGQQRKPQQRQQSRYCSPQSGGVSPRVVMPIDPAERDCLYATYLRARTPQSGTPDYSDMMLQSPSCATDGKTTMFSEDGSSALRSATRRSAGDVHFATPPVFKGFERTLELTPADSPTESLPLHF